jgi:hypothetical protein
MAFMDESRLIFGPVGSALIFQYLRSGNELILDLHAKDGTRIHAELHKEIK